MKRTNLKRLLALVLALSMTMSFLCTTVMADDGSDDPMVLVCGKEEHVHDENCYKMVLVCGYGDEAKDPEDPEDPDTPATPEEPGTDDMTDGEGEDEGEKPGIGLPVIGVPTPEDPGEDEPAPEEPAPEEGDTDEPEEGSDSASGGESTISTGVLPIPGVDTDPDDEGEDETTPAPETDPETDPEDETAPETGDDTDTETGDEGETAPETDPEDGDTTEPTEDPTDPTEDPAEPSDPTDPAEPEEPSEHVHDDSCYAKVLSCGKEEHTHTEECYKRLVMGDPGFAGDDEMGIETMATVQEVKENTKKLTEGTWTVNDTVKLKNALTSTGNVTLIGSGTIDASGVQSSAITVESGTLTIKDSVTITGGIGTTLTANDTGLELNGRNSGNFRVGGGIYIKGKNSKLVLEGGTITGNTAQRGGGIFVGKDATLNMSGGTVSNNSTVGVSGWDSGEGNIAGEGGGIFVWGTATISGGQIINNTCNSTTDLGGGGLYVNNDGKATLINAKVINNTADGLGGGIAGCCHGEMSIVAVDGVAMYNNTANNKSHTQKKNPGGNDSTAELVDGHQKAKNAKINGSNAADFYTAGSVIVANYMTGGGSARYHVKTDKDNRDIADDEVVKYEGKNCIVALKANPTDESKAKVPTDGVLISGNKSTVHGGGIGCNGGLYFGSKEDNNIELYVLDLGINATKEIIGRDLKDKEFTFELSLESDGTKVATVQNDASGNITFNLSGYNHEELVKKLAKIAKITNDGKTPSKKTTAQINFILKETSKDDANTTVDKSEYKIAVTFDVTITNETVTLEHTTGQSFKNISVTYSETTFTKKDEKVTQIKDKDGNTVSKDLTGGITFTNEQKTGSLTLKKEIEGYDVTGPFAANASFEFTVSGTNNGITKNETVTLNNANHFTATLNNLPIGTYTITEKEVTGIDHYTWNQGTSKTSGTVEIKTGETATFTATNKYDANEGYFEITKVAELGANSAEFDKDTTFNFSYTIETTDGKTETGTFTLKDGDTKEFGPYLEGTKYTITETDLGDGWTTATGTITGTVVADQIIKETVTNHYWKTKDTSVSVEKTWSGEGSLLPSSISIQLYQDGAAYGTPVDLTAANGWAYTWEKLPERASETSDPYVYTIEETKITYPELTVSKDNVRDLWIVSDSNGYYVGVWKSNVTKSGNEYVIDNAWTPVEDLGGIDLVVIKIDGEEGYEDVKLQYAEFALKDAEGNVVATGTTDKDGRLSFNLIDPGTYTLEETKAPEGYNRNETIWTITVDRGTFKGTTFDVEKNRFYNVFDRVLLQNGKIGNELIIGNELKKYDLELNKQFDIEGTDASVVDGLTFTFDVHVAGLNRPAYDTTVTLNKGNEWTSTLSDLPYGTYSITERTPAGIDHYQYTGVTYTGPSGTQAGGTYVVRSGEDSKISVTATNKYEVDRVSLQLQKSVKLNGMDPNEFNGALVSGKTITFEISGTGVNGEVYETKTVTVTLGANGSGMSEVLEGLPVGTYTVKEISNDIAQYNWNSVTYTVDGVAVAGPEFTLDLTKYGDSASVNVSAENQYTLITGEVSVRKIVRLSETESTEGTEGATFTFTLTGTDLNGVPHTYTETVKAGETATFKNVPMGTYTVTESMTGSVQYYDWTSVTYSEGGREVTYGTGETDNGIEITLDAANTTGDVSVSLDVTNDYDVKRVSLDLEKTVLLGNQYGTVYEAPNDSNSKFVDGAQIVFHITNDPAGTVNDGKFAYDKEITLTLGADGTASATIPDLAVGTYYIREIKNDLLNFEFDDVSYTVGGDEVKDVSNGIVVELNETAAGTVVQVAAVNRYSLGVGDITIHKDVRLDGTVYGGNGNQITEEFTFTLTGTTVSGEEYKQTVTVKYGDTATFKDVPYGTYTIVEDMEQAQVPHYDFGSVTFTDEKGNTTKVSQEDIENGEDARSFEFTLEQGHTGEDVTLHLDVTDEYLIKKANLTITKDFSMDGKAPNDGNEYVFRDREFKFTITGTTAGGLSEYSNEITLTRENPTATFENVPVGVYTLTEVSGEVTDYNWDYVEITGSSNVTKLDEKSYSVNLTEEQTGATISLRALNHESVKRTGSLTISKEITIDDEPYEGTRIEKGNFRFLVTGKDLSGNVQTFNIDVPYGGSYTMPNLPFGTYTITEDGSTVDIEHYDFDGVTFTDDKGNTKADSITVTIGENQANAELSVSLKATNAYTMKKVNVEITKDFQLDNMDPTEDNEYVFTGKTFEFVLSGISADGIHEVNETVTVTRENPTATFKDIPVGIYTLTETSGNVDDYIWDRVVMDGDKVTMTGKNTFQIDLDGEESGNILTVTATNYESVKKDASITIHKDITIDGRPYEDHQIERGDFRFIISGTTLSGKEYHNELTVPYGGTNTLPNIPYGTYTITEDSDTTGMEHFDFDGVTFTKDGETYTDSIEITLGENQENAELSVEINATNAYTMKRVDLSITKDFSMDGNAPSDANEHVFLGKTFEFVLSGTSADGVYEVEERVNVTRDNPTATFTDIPVGTYTLTETSGNVDDYLWDHLLVSGDKVTQTGTDTFQIDLDGEDNGSLLTVTATNYETVKREGSITLSKDISLDGTVYEGSEIMKDRYHFTLTGTTLSGLPYSDDNIWIPYGESVTLTGLPYGTYTLTEDTTTTELDRYNYTGVTFTDSEGNTSVGSITFVISETQTSASATFTAVNEYTRKTGDMTITKTISGNIADYSSKWEFTIGLASPEDYVTLADSYSYTVTTANDALSDEQKAAYPFTGSIQVMRDENGNALTVENNGIVYTVYGVVTLGHLDTATVSGLPVGTEFYVMETDANTDGYFASYTGENGVITEDSTPAASYNNDRSYTPYTAVHVTKSWVGDTEATRPTSISVELLQDGVVINTATLSAANNWSASWTELEYGRTYTVREAGVPEGYTSRVTGGGIGADVNVEITNTYTDTESEWTSVSVRKEWVGDDEFTRPTSVTVTLLRDGTPYRETATLSAETGWAYTWTDLEANHTYSVVESDIPYGYTSTVEGTGTTFTVYNTWGDDTTIPDEDIPLTDLPDEDAPLEDLPDEDVPLDMLPDTGDNSNLALWLVLMIVSSVGLAVLSFTGRKGKKND